MKLGICVGFLFAVIVVGPSLAQTENPRLSLPRSHLAQADEAPVYLAGHVALAAGGVMEELQKGAGAVFLFRPGAADRFLDFLYGMNISLVLQAEYHRVNEDQRILSGDMIFRRYLQDITLPTLGHSLFFGLGFGVSEVTLASGGFEKGWELVGETGQEWNLRREVIGYWQLQYRSYGNNGHDFSHWSVKLGAGIPLPW